MPSISPRYSCTDTQYMSSKRFITVDWSKLAGKYDKTFGTKTPAGEVRAPSVGGAWAWFVDFVTANFQREWTCFGDRSGRTRGQARSTSDAQNERPSLLVSPSVSVWAERYLLSGQQTYRPKHIYQCIHATHPRATFVSTTLADLDLDLPPYSIFTSQAPTTPTPGLFTVNLLLCPAFFPLAAFPSSHVHSTSCPLTVTLLGLPFRPRTTILSTLTCPILFAHTFSASYGVTSVLPSAALCPAARSDDRSTPPWPALAGAKSNERQTYSPDWYPNVSPSSRYSCPLAVLSLESATMSVKGSCHMSGEDRRTRWRMGRMWPPWRRTGKVESGVSSVTVWGLDDAGWRWCVK